MRRPADDFAIWLAARARDAGHDADDRVGDEAIAVISALADMNGLTDTDAEQIAEVLNVSPAEVTAAHAATRKPEPGSVPHQHGHR